MPYGVKPYGFGSKACPESARAESQGCAGHGFCRVVPTCGALPLPWSEIQSLLPLAAVQQPLLAMLEV